MDTWGAAQRWSFWPTLAGALATTVAAVGAYSQATANKDDLQRRREARREIYSQSRSEKASARPRITGAGIGTEDERAALDAQSAAIDARADAMADELIPDDGVTWDEAGLATHFATVAMVANEVATFQRQGWLLLSGVWLDVTGSVVGPFAA